MIQSHLDCHFSKIQILLINTNVLNKLVICKRTIPKEKTCIIDMHNYLIYAKKCENTFYNILGAKLKNLNYIACVNFAACSNCSTCTVFFWAKSDASSCLCDIVSMNVLPILNIFMLLSLSNIC